MTVGQLLEIIAKSEVEDEAELHIYIDGAERDFNAVCVTTLITEQGDPLHEVAILGEDNG